ncbi:MAG: hypothetical protein JNM94_16715 [Phycisphaerae bacterium]|nr:hypothetical protein [Phycisphaerae bacterium]
MAEIVAPLFILAEAHTFEFVLSPLRGVGRLHPLFVHFPIGLVFAAAALELWRVVRREPGMHPATPALLVAAALTAVASTASGWFNAAHEYANEQTDALFWHRWIGTLSAAILVAVAGLAWRARSSTVLGSGQAAGRLGAIVAAFLVAVAGHIGGELVRGEGYVLEGFVRLVPTNGSAAAAAPAALPTDPRERFFVERVQPILAAHCVECHGPKKQKGGLRLDPIDAAFVGAPDALSIVPGNPDDSELLIRVLLPAADADAMPPDGERLTPGDIDAIRTWIRDGAAYPASAGGAAPAPATRSSAFDDAATAVAARGGSVLRVAGDDRGVMVNASTASTPWTDDDLALLAPIADEIVELNLARTSITDAGLAGLPPMPRLSTLRLDHVALTDAAAAAIRRLDALETLNLVGTKIGDGGFATIADHPRLRRVYVFESGVTDAGIAVALLSNDSLDVIADVRPQPASPTSP